MKLKILHSGIDYSLKFESFTGAVNELDFTTAPLFIGFHKPLKSIYVELQSRIAVDSLEVEFWNGSAFAAMSGIEDETEGLTKSGPIRFSNEEQLKHDFDSSGKELYWIKITPSNNPALVGIFGINLVLSNDKDFGFVPNILDYLPDNLNSWIGFHEEARNTIVQTIRNSGKKIYQHETLETRQVDQFDLLQIDEFRNASKYLALHLIFDFLSKGEDDHYSVKSKRFLERYEQALNSNLMTVDLNDNGQIDEGENSAVQFIGIRRE